MSIFDTAVDLTDIPFEKWKDYIGNGYRSCHYTTDADRNGRIILLGYDPAGNPATFICPHRSWIKHAVRRKTAERDIYGRYVDTRTFKNAKARSSYVDACNGSLNIVECLRPESEFLHKMFDSVALDKNFNTQPLRIQYIDIETVMTAQFEPPKTARNPINMITVHDSVTKKYHTWTTGECSSEFSESPMTEMPGDLFEIRKFRGDERSMLLNFVRWMENNPPDVICGWNSQSYDIPYIVNRVERVLGNPDNVGTGRLSETTKRLSPVGRVSVRENNTENQRANKQAEILAEISGIFLADALVLYRDKFKIKNPLDGGYGLSNVGEAEGLGRKVAYEGNLKTLYENDFQKFYEYNVRDVDLLRRIEEKCRLIQLSRTITSSGLSDYNSIYSSIGYLVGSLVTFARTNMGKAVFTSYKSRKDSNEKFEGAFVFEPVPSVYRDGIAVVDYNSLYPSSIRAANISPETYVGKISRNPIGENMEAFKTEPPIDLETETGIERFYLLSASGEQKTVSREKLDGLLREKCIFTRNNTLFLKHSVRKGVVAEWCTHFFNLRKATKKEMGRLKMSLHRKEVPESEIPKTEELIQYLDSRQQALKIMINSIYGIIGTAFSPIYNLYMAQTITRTGKFCNINAALHVAEVFNKKFGSEFALPPPPNLIDVLGDSKKLLYLISGDTDTASPHTSICVRKCPS
jgi:DNA polymerase elongation subunit (family B)